MDHVAGYINMHLFVTFFARILALLSVSRTFKLYTRAYAACEDFARLNSRRQFVATSLRAVIGLREVTEVPQERPFIFSHAYTAWCGHESHYSDIFTQHSLQLLAALVQRYPSSIFMSEVCALVSVHLFGPSS